MRALELWHVGLAALRHVGSWLPHQGWGTFRFITTGPPEKSQFSTFSSTLSLGSEAAGDISVLGFAGVIFNLEKSCWLPHPLCHPQAVLFLLFPSANLATIYPASDCHAVTGIWSVVVATHGLCVLLC